MKPVAIFRHVPIEGPGYLATFLDEREIAWQLVSIDEGEAVPGSAADFAGLVFMGGPMSVNDNLPWIAHALDLIRDAVAREVPVLGHCLGGQLLARALGATVSRNPVKEIGWQKVAVEDSPEARRWFGGDLSSFMAFHWHGETFAIPQNASRLLRSEHCPNQAFAFADRHLGLQCHVEMTPELIRSWCETGAREIENSRESPAVNSAEAILAQMDNHLPALNAAARHLYTCWISGLR